ncbi:TetR/AcrR family transcriptional regulator [Solirubrobacter phytolaccae]|uniref:TetR/AcrR family transcriptional regulator n=1 Tax=Solirubrobacter phytolaccae TaxID=1404360 RepID=A0A9X3N3N8_9ACTN|nr:TetR/AcrR family transcriptional regulator [Solirubrobacter phytolaccae]MDA0179260.1 TetR/AcrR family transcriptional regulator [Solirubrobacter phytolaccae]
MAGVNPRQRLLNAAIDHIAERGVSDLSLRELAAAIGSSHRMLNHHFGGREGLLVAVVHEVEARQRALLDDVMPDPQASPGDAMRAWWRHISDPSLWPNERLFFELYGQALQGRPGTVALLDGIVDSWLEPAATLLTQLGLEDGEAAARLGIAVTRGLLLDLIATRDRARVDAAMEVHIAAMEALLSRQSRPADAR